MEPKILEPNPTGIATKWAIVNTGCYAVLTIIFQSTGMNNSSPLGFVIFIPFIGLLLLTQFQFKNSLGGIMTFRQGFAAGFRYALFAGLLIGVFMVIYIKWLGPKVPAAALKAQQDQFRKQGKTEDQIKDAFTYGPVIFAFGSALTTTIVGAIISFISAALMRKEN